MENKTDKPYSLQDARNDVAKEMQQKDFWNCPINFKRDTELSDAAYKYYTDSAELYKEKATEELRKENDELKAKKPFLGWTNDKDILNSQREYWGAINGLTEVKAEIERLKESNKELVEALKTSYNYMHVFLIRNEQPLVGEKLNEDAMLVLSLLQKSEGDVNKKI